MNEPVKKAISAAINENYAECCTVLSPHIIKLLGEHTQRIKNELEDENPLYYKFVCSEGFPAPKTMKGNKYRNTDDSEDDDEMEEGCGGSPSQKKMKKNRSNEIDQYDDDEEMNENVIIRKKAKSKKKD